MIDARLDFRSGVPLYIQLTNILTNEIVSNSYKPDDKFFTEREIIENYHISANTVKGALNILVHRGLLYRRPRKGTFIKSTNIINNTSIAQNTYTENITLVFPKAVWEGMFNPFYSKVLEGVEDEISDSGFHLDFFILKGSPKKESILYSKIIENRTKGIFILGGELDKELLVKIKNTGIPFVLIDNPENPDNIKAIMLDNINGSYKAVQYLINKGHKKIAYLGGGTRNKVCFLRLEGYKKAMESAGLKIDNNFIIQGERLNSEYGFKSMDTYIKKAKKLPTAIFAVNDVVAIGAHRALVHHGLSVPDDISLIGFDDIEMSGLLQPPLTTMRVDREKMGRTAVKMMLGLIKNNGSIDKNILLQPKLIERKSVKDLKQ